MSSILEIYSKGLYSSWCYHKPTRSLFDCGEGFASYQGNYLYGVERVFISHGHVDHVAGLPSLIGCRVLGRGDHEKPLTIFYPAGDPIIQKYREMIEWLYPRLPFQLKWCSMVHGDTTSIGKDLDVAAFEMQHQKRLTLGYKVVERRKALRPEYKGQNIPELLKGGMTRDELMQFYSATTFAYCLDSFNFNPYHIKDADSVVMDCTFLKDSDREAMTHFTLEESWKFCKEANVKHLIAAHFSPRYSHQEITRAHNNLISSLGGFEKEATLVYPGRIEDV